MGEATRDGAAVQRALTALISTHYRPTGHDAAGTFRSLAEWVQRLELGDALKHLSVVHVAGTKGKGSTCAFAESVLRTCGRRTGLFTSPHLVDIRERIQIDGSPVSEEVFAAHFWWCHDRLKATATDALGAPPYFYFLTLLALRIFHAERVDVAVLEVGLGGRWDATNVVPSPVVCGITSLGYDHLDILGHTLTLIAGEKAGIMKAGVPTVTTTQPEEAAVVLEARARELQVPLLVAPSLESVAPGGAVELGLAGAHQRLNAAIAVQLCRLWATRSRPQCPDTIAHEQAFSRGELPAAYAAGLARTYWPGRAQVVPDSAAAAPAECAAESAGGELTFYLDGAHTGESSATCADWFVEASAAEARASPVQPEQQQSLPSSRVLIFNCMKEREPRRLLEPLASVMASHGIAFQHAIFVPVEPAYMLSTVPTDLSWQTSLQQTWDELQRGAAAQAQAAQSPTARAAPCPPPTPKLASAGAAPLRGANTGGSRVLPSTSETLAWLRRHARDVRPARVQVLVTGSLYLVGDFLRLLRHKP